MDDKLMDAINSSVADAGEKFIFLASTTIQNMDSDYWMKLAGAGLTLAGLIYVKKKFL